MSRMVASTVPFFFETLASLAGFIFQKISTVQMPPMVTRGKTGRRRAEKGKITTKDERLRRYSRKIFLPHMPTMYVFRPLFLPLVEGFEVLYL